MLLWVAVSLVTKHRANVVTDRKECNFCDKFNVGLRFL